ncbi:somatomedin-B and thrombospondin type-1 domain-containing protein-like [Prionailurus iriomotensis]
MNSATRCQTAAQTTAPCAPWSFSEYQDGAADGAEEGDPPEPCKKQPRLDTECG